MIVLFILYCIYYNIDIFNIININYMFYISTAIMSFDIYIYIYMRFNIILIHFFIMILYRHGNVVTRLSEQNFYFGDMALYYYK